MANRRQDIDRLLNQWPFEPGEVTARIVEATGDREVLQMRVEMGVLQMEITGRPDGTKPHGSESYLDYLIHQTLYEDDDFQLSEEQCGEVDREFVLYYHRRICWLALRRFADAAADADHTLALMDLSRRYSHDESWSVSHEQYRPFVLFHRVQAAALAKLEDDGPDNAISEINEGLEMFRAMFAEYEAEERFEGDELVTRLVELRESLRDHYTVGRTLDEQLTDAVASEQYELAAQIRDRISKRDDPQI